MFWRLLAYPLANVDTLEHQMGWDIRQESIYSAINKDVTFRNIFQSRADEDYFPNRLWDCNFSTTSPQSVGDQLFGSHDKLDASFINSRLHKIELTRRLYEHLTLT